MPVADSEKTEEKDNERQDSGTKIPAFIALRNSVFRDLPADVLRVFLRHIFGRRREVSGLTSEARFYIVIITKKRKKRKRGDQATEYLWRGG